jgi:cytochrome c-type protein NapB
MKKIVIASVAALALVASASAAVNGKACVSCHGMNFEKKALGKSVIVKDQTHATIAEALKGYKAGTFGGPMKGVMKAQVSRYTDAELEAFAQTIGK